MSSRCPVCGVELVELERWTFMLEDFAEEKRRQLGADIGLTATEQERVERMIGNGSIWRQVACPIDPNHTGFLAERVSGQ